MVLLGLSIVFLLVLIIIVSIWVLMFIYYFIKYDVERLKVLLDCFFINLEFVFYFIVGFSSFGVQVLDVKKVCIYIRFNFDFSNVDFFFYVVQVSQVFLGCEIFILNEIKDLFLVVVSEDLFVIQIYYVVVVLSGFGFFLVF